jgi:TolA-binding protein
MMRSASSTVLPGAGSGWKRRVALAGLVLLAGSCFYTKSEGDDLKREVETLKQRLSGDMARAETERVKLQKIMEQATALLTRNSADVGAQVERIQAKSDKLTGQMEVVEVGLRELQQKISEVQAKVEVKLEGIGTGSSAKTPPTPENKDELFQLAQSKVSSGNPAEGRRLLRLFIDKNPSDPRLDRAQLLLGDSYFGEEKFAAAIVEYKKIEEQFKKSALLPDGFYKIGMSFYQLKFCNDAEIFLSRLLKQHKAHPQSPRAEKVLQLIKRYKRDPKICR